MSEENRRNRPQVINVERLIVNADEVIIIDERRNRRRDPWGFGPRPVRSLEMENVRVESDRIEDIEGEVEEEFEERRRRRPRPW